MALTITGISDARWYLGPSLVVKMLQCVPASADYPTGGWVITAEQCEFGNGHIYGAVLMNQEYGTTAPLYEVNLPTASYATTPQPSTTQFTVSALWSAAESASAALLAEVAASTDLSSYPFWLLVFGY